MIKTIKVSNLGPFGGTQEINLPEGVISVEGRYSGNNLKSNRAGKTFFVTDLLMFALYGKHRFSSINKMVHRGVIPSNQNSIGVSLLMEDMNGSPFNISRVYDNTLGKFILNVSDLDMGSTTRDINSMTQTEVQDYTQSFLGSSYVDANITWMVKQDMIGESKEDGAGGVMDMQAVDRKQFLLDTFSSNSIPWDAYYTEALARYKFYNDRATALQININNMAEKLATLNIVELKEELSKYTSNKRAILKTIKEIETTIKSLNTTLNESRVQELRQNVDKISNDILLITNRMTNTRRQLPVLQRLKEKSDTAKENLKVVEDKIMSLELREDVLKVSRLQQLYSESLKKSKSIEVDLKVLVKKITGLNSFSSKGSICPITGVSCSAGKSIVAILSDLNNEASVMEQAFKDINKQTDLIEKELTELVEVNNEVSSLRDSSTVLRKLISDGAEADINLLLIEEGLKADTELLRHTKQLQTEAQRQLDLAKMLDIVAIKQQIQQLDIDIRKKNQEILNFEEMISVTQGKINYLMQTKNDISKCEEELAIINTKIDMYKTLLPSLSKDGIPFFTLLSSISEFEYAVNCALKSLGSDIRITVSPYTELTTLDNLCYTCGFVFNNSSVRACPVCKTERSKKRKETLAIQFRGLNYNVEFTEDSGGGRLLVALAIRLALFKVFKSRGRMSNIDFWVLDEVFSPLDALGKTSMLQFLEDLGSEYGLKQIFVISHTDISDIIPPTVIIERDADRQISFIR